MRFLFFLSAVLPLIVWSLPLQAAQKSDDYFQSGLRKNERQEGSLKVIEWLDDNSGKPLLIQKFDAQGNLLFESEHRPGISFPTKISQVSLQNRDRKIEYYNPKNGKLEKTEIRFIQNDKQVIEVRIPASASGGKETVYKSHFPLYEEIETAELCRPSKAALSDLRSVKELSDFVGKILITGKKGKLHTTSMGILIDPACMKLHGSDFPLLVQTAYVEGLSCLKKMDGFDSRGNFRKIVSILSNKENPLKIDCSSPYSRWETAAAHATTSADQKDHPRIDLNPTYKSDRNYLKNTLFHELFHNIGYQHEHDIEYPYMCGSCCFDKKKKYEVLVDGMAVDAACEICKGDFVDANDKDYLTTLIKYDTFADASYSKRFLLKQIISDPRSSDEKMTLLGNYFAGQPTLYPLYSEYYSLKGAKLKLDPPNPMAASYLNPSLQPSSRMLVAAINSADAGNFSETLKALEIGIAQLPPMNKSKKTFADNQVADTYQVYEEVLDRIRYDTWGAENDKAMELLKQVRPKK